MNTILDFFVNSSPFVFIIGYILVSKFFDDYNFFNNIIFIILFYLYPAVILFLIYKGYGEIIFSLLAIFAFLITELYGLLVFLGELKLHELKKLEDFLFIISVSPFFLIVIGSIYVGKFLLIESLDVSEILLKFINNDWIKGITIGIMGTVVGGLILNKITKK